MSEIQQYVYRQEVLSFVTTAVEVCLTLEKTTEISKQQFLKQMTTRLPLLYSKAHLLQLPEQITDEYLQRFVTEEDYNLVSEGVKQMLGNDDVYLEVFVEDMRYSAEPVSAFISENLADIYQELKDMAFNFQTRQETVMNDAIYQCLCAFREHWGQKLLNVMRPLHSLWLEESNKTDSNDDDYEFEEE